MLPIVLTTALEVPRGVVSRARRAVIVGGATSGAAAVANVALLSQPASAARPRDDSSYEVRRTPAEWSAALSEQQYFVLREGGTEAAAMSTTSSLNIAMRYALSRRSLLLRIAAASFMQAGADLSFLSAFPGEKEMLYPPGTYLWPTGQRQTVELGDTPGESVIVVVEVEPTLPS